MSRASGGAGTTSTTSAERVVVQLRGRDAKSTFNDPGNRDSGVWNVLHRIQPWPEAGFLSAWRGEAANSELLQSSDGAATQLVAERKWMCGLGRTAGSVAQVPLVYCGVSRLVDRSRCGDAGRDAPASHVGDFVLGHGSFADRPVRGSTHLIRSRSSERDLEVRLPLSWRICLARAASSAAIGLNQAKVVGAIRNRIVRRADLHAVQHVEELHA